MVQHLHRTRSGSSSFGSTLLRPSNNGGSHCHNSSPRVNNYIKLLCVIILVYIVIFYWEGVSWNDYLLQSSVTHDVKEMDIEGSKRTKHHTTSTTTTTTNGNSIHDATTFTPPPPTISPTIMTYTPTPKVNEDDDDDTDTEDDTDDNNIIQNNNHQWDKNKSPTTIITIPTTTKHQLGSYLSVYDAYQQSQQSSSSSSTTKSNTETTTTNSLVTWFQIPKNKKWTKIPNNIHQKNDGKEFVQQWCDMTGTTWYPNTITPTTTKSKASTTAALIETTNTTLPWQLRAPYFLLPGAAYSGTVYMSSLLYSHPQIVPTRTKELQFFHDKPFRKYIHPISDQTLVHPARQRMYARDYNVQQLQRHTTWLSFDATPGYLYYSTILPRRILCVEPWIKIVLLLRNPVDRILEHYYAQYAAAMVTTTKNQTKKKAIPPHLSLKACMEQELNLMTKVGLLYANSTKEEDIAWDKYQALSHTGGLLGRSMYVIQLRHWIAAFRMAGRIPNQSIVVVYSEMFVVQPQLEYDRMVQFLHLDPHTIPVSLLQQIPPSLTHQTRYVSDETRQRLEDFIRPYNQQLQRLLYRYDISS